MPVSVIDSLQTPGPSVTSIATLPPARLYLIALLNRFITTCFSRSASASTAACGGPAGERPAGSWSALAFRTTNPPDLAQVKDVELQKVVVVKGKATVTALASDALSPDARAVVQVGVECAP